MRAPILATTVTHLATFSAISGVPTAISVRYVFSPRALTSPPIRSCRQTAAISRSVSSYRRRGAR